MVGTYNVRGQALSLHYIFSPTSEKSSVISNKKISLYRSCRLPRVVFNRPLNYSCTVEAKRRCWPAARNARLPISINVNGKRRTISWTIAYARTSDVRFWRCYDMLTNRLNVRDDLCTDRHTSQLPTSGNSWRTTQVRINSLLYILNTTPPSV